MNFMKHSFKFLRAMQVEVHWTQPVNKETGLVKLSTSCYRRRS